MSISLDLREHEHHEHVEAVCTPCHKARERARTLHEGGLIRGRDD